MNRDLSPAAPVPAHSGTPVTLLDHQLHACLSGAVPAKLHNSPGWLAPVLRVQIRKPKLGGRERAWPVCFPLHEPPCLQS